jgi:flagellar biosynthesis component FlhA
MDPNTITLAQLGVFFMGICGGIAAVGTALTWVLKALGFLRAPEKKQDELLKDHESRIKRLEEKANSDYENIQELQKEMKILLAATLATVKHQLDGNDVQSLQKARENLEEYLINK